MWCQRVGSLDTDVLRTTIVLCIDLHATERPLVHYVIVRKDISAGQQAAQILHAAGESAIPRPRPGTIAVALHARDELHLKCIAFRLYERDIPYVEVIEDDGQLMAIGLHPTRNRDAVRKVTSDLALVK